MLAQSGSLLGEAFSSQPEGEPIRPQTSCAWLFNTSSSVQSSGLAVLLDEVSLEPDSAGDYFRLSRLDGTVLYHITAKSCTSERACVEPHHTGKCVGSLCAIRQMLNVTGVSTAVATLRTDRNDRGMRFGGVRGSWYPHSWGTGTQQVRMGYFAQPQAFLVGCARGLFDHGGMELGCFPQSSGPFAVSKLEEGQLDLAMVGSSPLAEAVARGVPLQTVYIALEDDSDQGLVVRPHILAPDHLRGTRIGTPFTSTSHYQLMFLSEVFALEADDIEIVNLSPSAIMEQWASGQIDGAYVWGTTFRHLLETDGRLFISSGAVANWDRATFQVLAVARPFAEAHPEFVRNFVKVISLLDASRRTLRAEVVGMWDPELPSGFITSVTDGMYRNESSLTGRQTVASWMQPAPTPTDQVECYLLPACSRPAIPGMLTVLQTAGGRAADGAALCAARRQRDARGTGAALADVQR